MLNFLGSRGERGGLKSFMRKKVEIVGIMGGAGARRIITIKGMQLRSGDYAPEECGNRHISLYRPRPFTPPVSYTLHQPTVYLL